jgi:hypothetical protein
MDAHGAAVGVGIRHCAIAKAALGYWETPHLMDGNRATDGHGQTASAPQLLCRRRFLGELSPQAGTFGAA